MTRKEKFTILDQFLGYGDPLTARVIFVLIEEAGNDSDSEELADAYVERRREKYLLFKDWEPQGQSDSSATTKRLRSFAERILKREGILKESEANWKSDREANEYFSKVVFFSNLLPLANPKLGSWRENNSALFSPYENRSEYEKKYIDKKLWIERIKSLHQLLKKNGYSPTVLFMCKSFLDYGDYETLTAIFERKAEIDEATFIKRNVIKSTEPPGLIFAYHPLAHESFDEL